MSEGDNKKEKSEYEHYLDLEPINEYYEELTKIEKINQAYYEINFHYLDQLYYFKEEYIKNKSWSNDGLLPLFPEYMNWANKLSLENPEKLRHIISIMVGENNIENEVPQLKCNFYDNTYEQATINMNFITYTYIKHNDNGSFRVKETREKTLYEKLLDVISLWLDYKEK